MVMSRRLLILTLYYPPDLSAGSFRAASLVQALREQAPGLAIDVLTGMPSRYQSFTTPAAAQHRDERLTIRRLPMPAHRGDMRTQAWSYSRFAWHAARAASEHQYDLILATSSRLMTATLGAWVSRRSGTPLYLDIRDLFADTMNDVLSPRVAPLVRPLLSSLERWTMRRATRANLVSPGFAPYFDQRYPGLPQSLFTNGIDDDFLPPHPARPPVTGDRPITIVYAGNFGEGQGLHLIIPALAARLGRRAQFRLIGDGSRRAALMEGLAARKISNVDVLPPMSRADLVAQYHAADVLFLHLNDYDAFTRVLPSKVFEYAAVGTPILAGVGGFAADFFRAEVSNAAVFAPCDVEAALRALDTLSLPGTPRDTFVAKYARRDIMRRMASEITGLFPSEPGR